MESNIELKLPVKKWNYMHSYSSENYGAHSMAIAMGNLTLFYSYDTVVSFNFKGLKYVSENLWGRTTGKHLNAIGGSKRIKREEFEQLLKKALEEFRWASVLT